MAKTTRELLVEINAKISGLQQKMKQAGDDTEKSAKKQESSYKRVTKSVQALKVAIGAIVAALAVRQVIAFTTQMVNLSGESRNLERAFINLVGSEGEALKMLNQLREATKGTVSDMELMRNANTAILLGLPKSAEEMAELAKIARILGRAVGRDATSAFQDLTTGIGRQSRLILDNLGLIVKVSEANEAYAQSLGKSVDELTAAESKQAFFNATMDAARSKASQLGDAELEASEKLKALNAEMDNFRVLVAGVIAGPAGQGLDKLLELMKRMRIETALLTRDLSTMTDEELTTEYARIQAGGASLHAGVPNPQIAKEQMDAIFREQQLRRHQASQARGRQAYIDMMRSIWEDKQAEAQRLRPDSMTAAPLSPIDLPEKWFPEQWIEPKEPIWSALSDDWGITMQLMKTEAENFVDVVSNEFARLAMEGEINFGQMTRAILADMTALISKALILKALTFLPGPAGAMFQSIGLSQGMPFMSRAVVTPGGGGNVQRGGGGARAVTNVFNDTFVLNGAVVDDLNWWKRWYRDKYLPVKQEEVRRQI